MKQTAMQMVQEFHETFGIRLGTSWSDPKRRRLRRKLIGEEYREYILHEEMNDKVGVADALGDLLYVVCGAALEYGIPLDAVVEEIHRSNMSKMPPDGVPVIRDDGKILKPVTWTRPDIERVLTNYES